MQLECAPLKALFSYTGEEVLLPRRVTAMHLLQERVVIIADIVFIERRAVLLDVFCQVLADANDCRSLTLRSQRVARQMHREPKNSSHRLGNKFLPNNFFTILILFNLITVLFF